MDTCASTATNAAPVTAHPAAYAARLAVPFRAGATVVARVCTGMLLPDGRSNDVYLGGVGVVRVRDELGDHRAGLVVRLDAQLVDRKPGDLQLVAGDLRDHGGNLVIV